MAAEGALKAYIQENAHDVFGEVIRWVGQNLPRAVSRLSPDFIGYDVNGNLVIVSGRQPLPQSYTSMTKNSILSSVSPRFGLCGIGQETIIRTGSGWNILSFVGIL